MVDEPTPKITPQRVAQHAHVLAAPKVLVVGAGIGGLVSALLLANAGAEVTVLESKAESGGKMRQLWPGAGSDLGAGAGQGNSPMATSPVLDGIDSGPTVLTMKWVFEEIFAQVGAHLDRELNLTQLDVLARHAWSADQGGQQLTLYADHTRNLDAVAEFSGSAEAKKFNAFCQSAKSLYQALEGAVIREAQPSLTKMLFSLGPKGLATLSSIGPMKTLWESLGSSFNDPRLRQLFARYATYCGSSPWSAPATLMLIAQVEMDGVWSVEGGMRTLAKTLERLARQRGVQFRFQTACRDIEIHQDRFRAVHTESGERIEAQALVFNGDIEALLSGSMGSAVRTKMVQRASKKSERSLSALTWTMRCTVREERFQLDRHNVFFQNNYFKEFDDIFNNKRLPESPTVYICAQNRGVDRCGDRGLDRDLEPSATASADNEPIFCLVNAPATGDTQEFTQQELDQCETQTFNLLSRCGLHLERDPQRTIQVQPKNFHQLFPSTGGALYGQATHGWMQVFSRSNASTPIQGLFLTGGSVHPGPGVPMVAMSARLAVAIVTEHLGLTRR